MFETFMITDLLIPHWIITPLSPTLIFFFSFYQDEEEKFTLQQWVTLSPRQKVIACHISTRVHHRFPERGLQNRSDPSTTRRNGTERLLLRQFSSETLRRFIFSFPRPKRDLRMGLAYEGHFTPCVTYSKGLTQMYWILPPP